MILAKGTKTTPWQKDYSFQQMLLHNQTSICKRMKPYLTAYIKFKSKWIIELTIRGKTIKLLEEKKGVNLCYLRLGNRFLGITLNDEEKLKNDDYCMTLFK